MLIRPATPADLTAVGAIYAHEAAHGLATFDTEPRSPEAWHTQLASTAPGDHLLVVADEGAVVGYAASFSYRPRPAYRWTREAAIYLTEAARGRGAGTLLYTELLGRLRADQVHRVLAVIAQPNPASAALHRSCGFESVGVLHEVGHKFGRWIDTELFQLRLTPS